MNIKHLMESQLKATQLITKKFGQTKALEFLLEETLYAYLKEHKADKEIAAFLPMFIQEIKKQFDDNTVNEYLTSLKEETKRKIKMVQKLQKVLKLVPLQARTKKMPRR